MELIIVRHGQSEGNKADIAAGPYSPLTKEGEQQAQDLAKRLQGLEIEKIFCSPFKRTKQTAIPIAKRLGMSVDYDQRLVEVSFGSFEGKPHDEVVKVLGKDPRGLFNDYEYDFGPYGGETSKEVEARVRSFLEDLREQDYKLVLIVTHGGIIRWINYILTGEKIGSTTYTEELHLNHQ